MYVFNKVDCNNANFQGKNTTKDDVDTTIADIEKTNVTNADNQALNALSEFFVTLASVVEANTTVST
jgi:hypothetical protein